MIKLATADGRASRRIKKEIEKFMEESASEGSVFTLSVQSPSEWQVSFSGAEGTLYAGERFTVRVRFSEEYPIDSPEVIFLQPVPVHSHIYSNGHICLNILGDDWSPALTVHSICLSLLSMLSSATIKVRPHDDETYSRMPRATPKQTRFLYHDDNV
eukprot:gene6706-7414_t